MSTELVHIGFGNIIAINRVIAAVSANSAPVKRLVQEAKARGQLIDVTYGRKTKAVLVMDSGHVVLAAIQPETIAGRLSQHQRQHGDNGMHREASAAPAASARGTAPAPRRTYSGR
jgi:regulator of extracellular matrix RemA (YlzA/DUF370 family)